MPYADPERKKAYNKAYHEQHRAEHLIAMQAWDRAHGKLPRGSDEARDKHRRNTKRGEGHGNWRPLEVRFWEKVRKTDECWEWTGTKVLGYGRIRRGEGRGTVPAHRVSYELHKGDIPEGLEIDHLCANHGCVNPDHLEAVTHVENMRRANARR